MSKKETTKTAKTTVVNRTKGTRKTAETPEEKPAFKLPEGLNQKTFDKAKKAETELSVIGKKVFSLWLDIGECLHDAKQLMPATKEFGSWASEAFPSIEASYRSKALLAYVHKETLIEWQKEKAPKVNNPHAIIRLYQKDTGIKLKSDGSTEKIPQKEKPESNTDTDTENGIDKGIAGITENLRLAMNRVIKHLPNYNGENLMEVINLAHSFNKALREAYPDHKPELTELDKLNETIQKIREAKKAS